MLIINRLFSIVLILLLNIRYLDVSVISNILPVQFWDEIMAMVLIFKDLIMWQLGSIR